MISSQLQVPTTDIKISTLTSPGYPLLPSASLFSWSCRWILKVPDDLSTGGAYVLKVKFNLFNLQKKL